MPTSLRRDAGAPAGTGPGFAARPGPGNAGARPPAAPAPPARCSPPRVPPSVADSGKSAWSPIQRARGAARGVSPTPFAVAAAPGRTRAGEVLAGIFGSHGGFAPWIESVGGRG